MKTVRAPESPPYCLTSKMTIWITNWRFFFQDRYARRSHQELQRIDCQCTSAEPIVSWHALPFQMPEIPLSQWQHHCSNTNSQLFSTNYPSLTVHHPPGCCCYASQLETRILHNPRLVLFRTSPNTKWQYLRWRRHSWRQLYSRRLLSQDCSMTHSRQLKKFESQLYQLRIGRGHYHVLLQVCYLCVNCAAV